MFVTRTGDVNVGLHISVVYTTDIAHNTLHVRMCFISWCQLCKSSEDSVELMKMSSACTDSEARTTVHPESNDVECEKWQRKILKTRDFRLAVHVLSISRCSLHVASISRCSLHMLRPLAGAYELQLFIV